MYPVFYPVILTDDVVGTCKFYCEYFRFSPQFADSAAPV